MLNRFSCVRLFAAPWMQPAGLLCPWILQARTLEWVATPFPIAIINGIVIFLNNLQLYLFYFCMFFWVVYIHIYFICVQCWIRLSINIQKTKIMASGPITSWEIDGETVETVSDFIFLGSKITADGDCSHEIKSRLLLGRKSYDQPRQHIKKQRHYFVNKGLSSQGCGFSGSYVWMWELDYKESWAPKNWCFWTVVLEKTLESPLDCKIQPVHLKGDQSWIFIGSTDVEAETPILWPPDAKSWLIWKDPDAGKDWGQEKGTTEDEMVEWHHRLNGHEFG